MLTLRSALVLILVLAALPAAARVIEGQAHVVDGDTLDVAGHRIRLFGIDAPERGQTCDRRGQAWACGEWSGAALAKAVEGASLSCEVVDQDRFDRSVAVCRVDGIDVAQGLVRQGAAFAYVRYSGRYLPDQALAEAGRLGLWEGKVQTPEAFRHPPSLAEADCPVKGNIGRNGRIFHVPGQAFYAKVRIDPAKGEGCFASPIEAEAAGFRAAQR